MSIATEPPKAIEAKGPLTPEQVAEKTGMPLAAVLFVVGRRGAVR